MQLHLLSRRRSRPRSSLAFLGTALAVTSVGALAVGAVALGAVAINTLAVRRARIGGRPFRP